MMQKEETAMQYSRAWAIARQQAEGELPVLAFFGPTAYPGRITETCLSQWYPCRFEEDGVVYNCAEQYMMAHKALIFGDRETLAQIMAAGDPKTCKALGRRVKPFDSAVWNREKYAVVVKGPSRSSARTRSCGPSWREPATPYWSRPAPGTTSGASALGKKIPASKTPPSGRARICWASR